MKCEGKWKGEEGGGGKVEVGGWGKEGDTISELNRRDDVM